MIKEKDNFINFKLKLFSKSLTNSSMKNSLVLLILVFNALILIGQSPIESEVSDKEGLVPSKTRYGLTTSGANSYEEALENYKELNGSPFLHGEEMIVDLVLHNDSLLEQVPMLYDVYNNELVARTKKGEIVILDKAYYKGFNREVDGVKIQYRRVNPQNPLVFYRVLYQNEDFVFCSQVKVVINDNKQYAPGQESLKKEFSKKRSHFLISNRKAKKVKLRKGALLTNLPEKYQLQVNDLKKKLKIKKLNKEKDYVRLMHEFEE